MDAMRDLDLLHFMFLMGYNIQVQKYGMSGEYLSLYLYSFSGNLGDVIEKPGERKNGILKK